MNTTTTEPIAATPFDVAQDKAIKVIAEARHTKMVAVIAAVNEFFPDPAERAAAHRLMKLIVDEQIKHVYFDFTMRT